MNIMLVYTKKSLYSYKWHHKCLINSHGGNYKRDQFTAYLRNFLLNLLTKICVIHMFIADKNLSILFFLLIH